MNRNACRMPAIAVRRARWGVRSVLAAGALLALVADPVAAQRDQVRVAGESQFEIEIEELARQLMSKRISLENLTRALQGLRMTFRAGEFPDSLRPRFEASIRQMQARLTSTETERARLQKKLGDLCGADLKPAGWMGMAFTGASRVWKDRSGPVRFRYLEYPSVESVESRSPADRAGIQGGDVIIAFGGDDIRERDIVFTELLKPGRKLAVKVRRGAETKTLTIDVERRPDSFETPCPWLDESIASAFAPVRMQYSFNLDDGARSSSPNGAVIVGVRPPASPAAPASPAPVTAIAPTPSVAPVPPTPSPFMGFESATSFVIAGAEIKALNADLADAFGAEGGLLVLSTVRGAPAEESGLKGGDVIVSAGGRAVNTPMAFIRAFEQSNGRELKLQILRKRRSQALVLRW